MTPDCAAADTPGKSAAKQRDTHNLSRSLEAVCSRHLPADAHQPAHFQALQSGAACYGGPIRVFVPISR